MKDLPEPEEPPPPPPPDEEEELFFSGCQPFFMRPEKPDMVGGMMAQLRA